MSPGVETKDNPSFPTLCGALLGGCPGGLIGIWTLNLETSMPCVGSDDSSSELSKVSGSLTSSAVKPGGKPDTFANKHLKYETS